RYLILPVLSIQGFITLNMFKGSVMKNLFLTFLREQLNLFPRERSVVVLDKCLIHHDKEVCMLIEDNCSMDFIRFSKYL
ncbi:hypothetical protein FA95DRAFT_1500073, partial [Auriscalpium vulgare]